MNTTGLPTVTRDLIAMHALASLILCQHQTPENAAQQAIAYADALYELMLDSAQREAYARDAMADAKQASRKRFPPTDGGI